VRAIQNLREMCDAHLQAVTRVEVIDICNSLEGAIESNYRDTHADQIASGSSLPDRGDLSHVDRV
jgi:hypothetical protein